MDLPSRYQSMTEESPKMVQKVYWFIKIHFMSVPLCVYVSHIFTVYCDTRRGSQILFILNYIELVVAEKNVDADNGLRLPGTVVNALNCF